MTTVTQKGQVTIPKQVRDLLDIKQGDKVIFEIGEKDVVIRKKEQKPQFRKYIGFLKGKTEKDSRKLIRELRNGV